MRGNDNATMAAAWTPKRYNKLFEPYYSKKIKGTGLGLTNAESIVSNT